MYLYLYLQEVVFGVMFAMSSVSLSLFVLVYFCASRNDVQESFRRLPGIVRAILDTSHTSKQQAYNSNVPGNVQYQNTIDGAHQTMGGVAITSNPGQQPLFQETQQIQGPEDLNFGLDGKMGQLPGVNDFSTETKPFLAHSENMDKQYTLTGLPPPPHGSLPHSTMGGHGAELLYGAPENGVGIRTIGYTGGAGITSSLKPGNISRTASNVASTASRARIKVNNMFSGGIKHGLQVPQKDSDLSSDHLSVNNMNHLRRGYVAPVNSEAEYSLAGGSNAPSMPPPPPPPPIIATTGSGGFGSYSNTNHPNIHADSFSSNINPIIRDPRNHQGFQIGNQPKTSSPTAGHTVPFTDQDLTVSPLINENREVIGPYDVRPILDHMPGNQIFFNNKLMGNTSLSNEGTDFMDYSGTSNIRVGDPCQMVSYATADLPSGMSSVVPSSIYGSPHPPSFATRFDGMPPPGFIGSSKSASLPRRPLYPRSDKKHNRNRNDKGVEDNIMRLSDVEDDSKSTGRYSAISMGSTAYSSRSGHSSKSKKNRDRSNRKRPNRRRPRKQSNDEHNATSNSVDLETSDPSYKKFEYAGGIGGQNPINHGNLEDEYLGDQDCDGDQFDSLDRFNDTTGVGNDVGNQDINARNVCKEPLIEQSEPEGQIISATDVARDESEELGPSSTSQYSSHSHFSSSDIPKRETSV